MIPRLRRTLSVLALAAAFTAPIPAHALSGPPVLSAQLTGDPDLFLMQWHAMHHPAYYPTLGNKDQTALRYGVTTWDQIHACNAYWEGKEYKEPYFGFDIPCPREPITPAAWFSAFQRAGVGWVLTGHYLPISSDAVPR